MSLLSSSNTSPSDYCFSSDDQLLLCGEDVGTFSDDDDAIEPREELVRPEEDEVVVMAMLVEGEGNFAPRLFRSFDPPAVNWSQSVGWILKVSNYYQFDPVTTYLAVSYMDRFLSSHVLPQPNGWPMQLLSVACLSLAAKMEETLVPSLLDLQVEDARFIFEPQTICRMELLVLTSLKWRLGLVTPFAFMDFFARKIDPDIKHLAHLTSRASSILLHAIRDIKVFEYYPSAIAASAIICAADEIPELSFIDLETILSWCAGLTRDGTVNCYQLMRELVVVNDKLPGPGRILPYLRVTTKNGVSTGVSSSTSSTPSCKRRKLNNSLWVEHDKEMT